MPFKQSLKSFISSKPQKVSQHDAGYNPSSTPSYQPGPPSNSYAYAPPPPPGPPPPDYAPPSYDYQQPQHQSQAQNQQPFHDWTVIPDTALLPPPPSIGYNESPSANASVQDSDRGLHFTRANPIWQPGQLTPAQHASVQAGKIVLLRPPEYTGDLFPQASPGHWKARSWAGCRDAAFLTSLPLYAALLDSPLQTEGRKTIYFEVKILGIGRSGARGSSWEAADAGVAVGFVAPPYPTFRLPGWERGSLGVHGDDGRRYVNDGYGGKDFVAAWQAGQTVGIGMTFSLPRNPPAYHDGAGALPPKMLDVEVFFTRDGSVEGKWNADEEMDVRSEGGTVGLLGECDLFAAVGVFGGVEFEVKFAREEWLYQPS